MITYGVYLHGRSRQGSIQVVLVGFLNFGCATSIMLWNSGSEHRVMALSAYGVFLLAVTGLMWGSADAAGRRAVLLGCVVLLGLTTVQFVLEGDSLTRNLVLIATTLLAGFFVALVLTDISRKVRSLRY